MTTAAPRPRAGNPARPGVLATQPAHPALAALPALAAGVALATVMGLATSAEAASDNAPIDARPSNARPPDTRSPNARPADPSARGKEALERARTTDVPLLLHVEPPRDSGRHIGDVVTYRALIAWPAGWQIDRDGIPTPLADTAPIELRGHAVRPAPDQCPNCRWLDLQWQLFKTVRMTEDLALPAPEIRFRRETGIATLALPPTVIAVSPLVPWEQRKGWADSIRPGKGPVSVDASRPGWQAAAAALLTLLAVVGWGWASGRWFVARDARPFARAWRAIARRGADHGEDADQDDLRQWHRAFDAAAGRTVLADRLDDFFAMHPRYAPLAPEIQAVFAASRRHFFTGTDTAEAALPRATLTTVLRRLADLEFQPLTGHAAV